MSNGKLYFLSVLAYLLLAHVPASASDTAIRVVTSFTILEDLARELGGRHVSVVNLVPRDSDAHMYQPIPSDSVAISNADLVIFNGLGFEGWIDRLIQDSGRENRQIVASDGVHVFVQNNETDPHAWQSFESIRVYVKNISDALMALRPQLKVDLTGRKEDYLKRLDQLESRLILKLAKTPVNERIVVTSHDAFGYLGHEFDITFLAPLGLSLDARASAEDISKVIDQIRKQNVTAIFVENINDPRLVESIASETEVAIGGRLYSDALSEVGGPADTYLGMMQHNIESLADAFNSPKN